MSEAATKNKRSAGASAVVPRLFVLEINAGRIHSMNTDGSDRKTIVISSRGFLLKRALEELHTQHHNSLNMEFLCDLGAGLIAMGEHQEALTLTVDVIDVQQRGGKFLYMPALLRMKGLILASRSAEDYSEAEASLLSAIDWAKRQSAALFELRAATDLAELLLKQDRSPEGYRHLSAALDRTPARMVSPAHTRALQILNRMQSGNEGVG